MDLQALDTAIRIATEIGVDPAEAIALWDLESGLSTDTNLRGAMTRHGEAVGPLQVIPKLHPTFPVAGSLEEQFRYGLNYYKKVGPRGYYGTGQPLPGHPTTDQYVSKLEKRINKYKNDPVIQAAIARHAQLRPAAMPQQPPVINMMLPQAELPGPAQAFGRGMLHRALTPGTGHPLGGGYAALENLENSRLAYNQQLLNAAIKLQGQNKPTTAQQNIAAVLDPSLPPQYRNLLAKYLMKPQVAIDQSVTGGIPEKPPLEGFHAWLEGEEGKRYLYVNPKNPADIGVREIPGLDKPTETEIQSGIDIDTAKLLLDDMFNLTLKGADVSGVSGLINEWLLKPELTSSVAKDIMSFFGYNVDTKTQDLILKSNQLTLALMSALRGAQVGPEEQLLLRPTFPVPGAPREQFIINMFTMLRQLDYAKDKAAWLRDPTKYKKPNPIDYRLDDYDTLNKQLNHMQGQLSKLPLSEPAVQAPPSVIDRPSQEAIDRFNLGDLFPPIQPSNP